MSIIEFPARAEVPVIGPGDPGYDDARGAFDLLVDQRPAAVALPRTPTRSPPPSGTPAPTACGWRPRREATTPARWATCPGRCCSERSG